MNIIENYKKNLFNAVNVFTLFLYTISFILIFFNIAISIIVYIKEYNNPETYFDILLKLAESLSLSLTIILTAEILKIFYIKTYRQLVIIASLTTVKLLVHYFLYNQIDKIIKVKK